MTATWRRSHVRCASTTGSNRRTAVLEPALVQVQLIDEDIDNPPRVVLSDVVVQALWQ
ncbi:hypothetical protein [Hydrogenophaga sp. BPS33]|uniref:hypothetical protein n=1 Tax=Hydrogenophaga sp. BPS33 TaxID=2651974 RepID=UPI001916FBA1|nr:hypothetical protein [Hydrogenophaga sp. BPS33]